MPKPIVWSIAGSDPSAGAGIQADLLSFQDFGVQPCTVIAAVTAQNSQRLQTLEFCSEELLQAQLDCLHEDLPAKAIKLGMVGNTHSLKRIIPYLVMHSVPVVYDPVLTASVGGSLQQNLDRDFLIKNLLPVLKVFTPNISEAEYLLGYPIADAAAVPMAAKALQALGPECVVIKGGHLPEQEHAADFWITAEDSGWLISPRLPSIHCHGTGCSFAAAIAALLALEYPLLDALVLAKAYVQQGIRLAEGYGQGPGPIVHAGFPSHSADLPRIASSYFWQDPVAAFPSCGPEPLGFYPIVDSYAWVKRLLAGGVKTLQLRIKDQQGERLRQEIAASIQLAKSYQARLFINDYWELALQEGAYGLHLGQEDLDTADIAALQRAGIRLGISTHSYYEFARALTFKPSYLACGPIFHTDSKIMAAKPQGIAVLKRYQALSPVPLVAIGGIKREHVSALRSTGVSGVALISAVTAALNPEAELEFFLRALQ